MDKVEYQSVKMFQQVDLLKIKLTSFEQLVKLSEIPFAHLLEATRNTLNWSTLEAEIPEMVRNQCCDNLIKLKIILNSLNAEQLNVFTDIYKNLNNPNGSAMCIDAPPGTGKTFLISCLLTTYKKNSTYIVYTNNLRDNMDRLFFEGTSINCCKFIMNMCGVNYYKAINFWNSKDMTLEEKCKEIEDIVKSLLPLGHLYILDEDSVVSPMYIYFLYCLHRFHKKHILFIGDRYQQVSINASRFHNRGNFDLISTFSQIYSLVVKVRQEEDGQFISILDKFTNLFDVKNDKKITFKIKYIIYELLQKYFHAEESFDSMYFAQYHTLIKARNQRYEQYLENNNIPYQKSFLCDGDNIKLDTLKLSKFMTYLILVKDKYYVFIPDDIHMYRVKLLNIGKCRLHIYNETLKREQIIHKRAINSHIVSEQLMNTLKAIGYKTLYQYPLKELTSTYHAAQGLTIPDDKVELNLDCSSLNSFYVGLTRIKKLDQLVKIHTRDFFNLLYTKRKNDAWFYKINKFPDSIELLEFVECTNTTIFEHCTSRNLKIKRECYISSKENENNTPLMEYINKIHYPNEIQEA
ncbi:helicase 2 [Penaeus monodon nudivirus]|uniref:Helicase 2 n=1 Tax=Penaeus monodon nudivirus TaxID=1529056 RepID=A0A076FER7_9VIRU|nr:helicase 2 [Penaeus monodon nudivirus]AII15864.1 helicase 2 [Penaeus monodon nudivirus]